MKTYYQYIHFQEIGSTTKTTVWSCRTNSGEVELGVVRWNGHWRQYCYFPGLGAVYSKGCLDDIAGFLGQANKEHREKPREDTGRFGTYYEEIIETAQETQTP